MKVYATFSQEVHIEPKQVIKKLIEKEIGDEYRNWIVEKDGKYYHIHEESAGCHSVDVEDEISKEKYDYVKALQLVLKRLN
jgi:hypothetical protein